MKNKHFKIMRPKEFKYLKDLLTAGLSTSQTVKVTASAKAKVVCSEGKAPVIGVVKVKTFWPLIKKGLSVGKKSFIKNAINQAAEQEKSA